MYQKNISYGYILQLLHNIKAYPHVAKMLTYSHSILSGPLVHEKDMVKIEMCTQRVHPHRPPHVKWGNGVFHDVVCVPPDAENSCKQPNYHYQWRICIGGYCCKRRLTSSVGGNMNVWCDENSYRLFLYRDFVKMYLAWKFAHHPHRAAKWCELKIADNFLPQQQTNKKSVIQTSNHRLIKAPNHT